MRGLFEGALYSRAWSNSSRAVLISPFALCAVYSEGANYSRKYGIYRAGFHTGFFLGGIAYMTFDLYYLHVY